MSCFNRRVARDLHPRVIRVFGIVHLEERGEEGGVGRERVGDEEEEVLGDCGTVSSVGLDGGEKDEMEVG